MKLEFSLKKIYATDFRFGVNNTSYKLVESLSTEDEIMKLNSVLDPNLLNYRGEWFKKYYHNNITYYIFSKRSEDYDNNSKRPKVKMTHHKHGGYTITCNMLIPIFRDIYII